MTDAACLFCRIIAGEIPATIIERGEHHIAFADIAPQAPVHILVAPLVHTARISRHTTPAILGEVAAAAARIGYEHGGEGGYRLVVNEGLDALQSVEHIHFHVLAGRKFTWPPG